MALSVTGIEGLPLVRPGDDLCAILLDAINAQTALHGGDVLVIAQKIVSKAEGRLVRLDGVSPSDEAVALAAETPYSASFNAAAWPMPRGLPAPSASSRVNGAM